MQLECYIEHHRTGIEILPHFAQKWPVLRKCYFGATYEVISVETHEWFCYICPYFKVYFSLNFSSTLENVDQSEWRLVHIHVTWPSVIHGRCSLSTFNHDVQPLLCNLYSCHLQTTQQPSNLSRFKVMSSFSIDKSADDQCWLWSFWA